MKIAISTLGCKVNHYDSAVIEESLRQEGYHIASFAGTADVYIINTCTVTEKTDAQSRQLIRRALKANPHACVIVTGCYAQHAAQSVAALSDRVHVLGNTEKTDMGAYLKQITGKNMRIISVADCGCEKRFISAPAPRLFNRTRAYLKIQDGCNARCSYCIVPSVRGPSRSCAVEEVLSGFRNLVQAGYQEVVLTGIHLGAYGLDLSPPLHLVELLKRLSSDTACAQIRLRLSSLEPGEISDELIDVISRTDIVCPHLHIPLQSGDESIIRKMNRSYSSAFFKHRIEKLVSSIPDINIGIDVIAGFPGESEEHFQNTLSLIQDLPVGYLHVFPYSRRPGTPAALLSDQVPEHLKRERAQRLRDESQRKKQRFYSSFLHKTLPVLVEGKRDRKTGLLKGFSKNYIPLLLNGPDELMGKEIRGRVTEVRETVVYAETA